MKLTRRAFGAQTCAAMIAAQGLRGADAGPVSIGNRRELFVDRELLAEMRDVRLELANPLDAGKAIAFDRLWEGAFCAYGTVLKDADAYRFYYRGLLVAGQDGNVGI